MSEQCIPKPTGEENVRISKQGLSKEIVDKINQQNGSLFTYYHKVGGNRKGGTGRRYATPYRGR